jgi:hypothetical protein
MLRRLVRDKMKEVIETEHQVKEPEEQTRDEYCNFHEI